MHCVVKNCTSSQKLKNKMNSFHKFPHTHDLKSIWIRALNLESDMINRRSVVCSNHFFDKDYIGFSKLTRNLLPSAVPHIDARTDEVQVSCEAKCETPAMTACILCREDSVLSSRFIEIFSVDGIHLNICSIISKHFWLQPNSEFCEKQCVCLTCWESVSAFHEFYQRIVEAHNYFEETKNEPIADTENDPFGNEVVLTSEELSSTEQLVEALDENFFDSEIKVEIHDLDLLPRTEIFEENTNFNELTQSANRRSLPLIEKVTTETTLDNEESDHELHLAALVNATGTKIDLQESVKEYEILYEEIATDNAATSQKKVQKKRDRRKKLEEPTNKCEICSMSFFSKSVLLRHIKKHAPDDQKINCPQCEKAFVTTYVMNQHLKLVHLNLYAKVCKICGKSIRGREAFQRHQLEHEGSPKPLVQCNLCGIKLISQNCLPRHMKTVHTEENPNPQMCNICSKVSPTISAHQRHMKYMHSMQRKHACRMCEKAFKRAQHLKVHMATHTGEVLYTCPHCPKTFNSNANMYSHRKKFHRKEWEEKRKERFIKLLGSSLEPNQMEYKPNSYVEQFNTSE